MAEKILYIDQQVMELGMEHAPVQHNSA